MCLKNSQLTEMDFMRGLLILCFISSFILQPIFPQETNYSDQDCLKCHGKPNLSQITQDGSNRSLYVNPEEWSQDVHHLGKMTCTDCHIYANPYLHFREGFIDVDCARCHPEEEEEYQKNIHLTFTAPSPGKELPLCYHCHTKHHVLPYDDVSSSVHENNIGETCGTCHPEVMTKGVFKGASLGKVSGHRKGDMTEKFDMQVCIRCHYSDSAHGAKRPLYKDFCSRCHDIRSKGNIMTGPLHLDSKRWIGLNYTGLGLVLLFLLGIGVWTGLAQRKSKSVTSKLKCWLSNIKKEIKPVSLPEKEIEQEKGSDLEQ